MKRWERGNKPYKRGRYYWAYVDGRRVSLRETTYDKAKEKFDRLVGGEDIRTKLWFEDAVKAYEGSLRFKQLAPASQLRHSWSFDKFLIPHFRHRVIGKIRPLDVREYIEMREGSGAAPNTILKETTALSAVFTWHVEHGKLTYNPVRQVGTKPSKQDLVRPNYTPTEVEILKVLGHLHKNVITFFLALCNTGARVNELRMTNVSDFDPDLGTLRIIRKGGKQDVLVLNDLIKERISDDLLKRAEKQDVKQTEPLFLNRYKTRLLSIKRSLKFACERAKVPHLSHHALRHGYATILFDMKDDDGRPRFTIPDVANLLGNSVQVCTDIYVKWQNRKKKDLARTVEIGRK
jgi:integrase/recombinase XerC